MKMNILILILEIFRLKYLNINNKLIVYYILSIFNIYIINKTKLYIYLNLE